MVRILAISGSLRAKSSNTAVLRAAMQLAPPGMTIDLFEGMAHLPLFNPDLDASDDTLPAEVVALRAKIADYDGLLIACPEYAHGVPGPMKNLLDWLVGSLTFPEKPVALFNAAAHASHAQAQLRETLRMMSGRFVESGSATIPLPNNTYDTKAILESTGLSDAILAALNGYAEALTRPAPSPARP